MDDASVSFPRAFAAGLSPQIDDFDGGQPGGLGRAQSKLGDAAEVGQLRREVRETSDFRFRQPQQDPGVERVLDHAGAPLVLQRLQGRFAMSHDGIPARIDLRARRLAELLRVDTARRLHVAAVQRELRLLCGVNQDRGQQPTEGVGRVP